MNLSSPIQTQLQQKRIIFSDFSVTFQESTPNLKHFSKKDDRHSFLISEIRDCERLGYTTL